MKYSATWFLNDRLNTPVPYLTEEHCSCVNTAAVVSVSIPHCTPIPSYNGRQYSDPCYSILLWIKFGGCAVNIIYCPRPTAAHTAHIWHNPLRVSRVHLIYVGIRLLLMDQFSFTDKNKGMCVRICALNLCVHTHTQTRAHAHACTHTPTHTHAHTHAHLAPSASCAHSFIDSSTETKFCFLMVNRNAVFRAHFSKTLK